MPGLHILISLQPSTPSFPPEKLINSGAAACLHDDSYRFDWLEKTATTRVGYSRYDHYPLTQIHIGDWAFTVEGRIYHPHARDGLGEIAAMLGSFVAGGVDRAGLADRIAQSTGRLDGEFIVVCLNKRLGTTVVFNDGLGRLPLYQGKAGGTLVLSREPAFVQAVVKAKKVDKQAVSEQLLWGFPLGPRTFFQEVSRVDPGTVFIGDTQMGVSTYVLASKNVEEYASHQSVSSESLAVEFRRAAKRRLAEKDSTTIVSLSGGLDSRCVAAAVYNEAKTVFASFDVIDKRAAADLRVAEQLAERFGLPLEKHELPLPTQAQLHELWQRKRGHNNLTMAVIVPFFRSLRNRYGADAIYLTGDGGDRILPRLTPARRFRRPDELARYLHLTNAAFDFKQVGELLGMRETDLNEQFLATLASYPEKKPVNRVKHFLLWEHAFKWLFEGEDRNRSYLWSTSPFYSQPFFQAAMGVPDDQKTAYRFYRRFLGSLNPLLGQVENANWNSPPNSPASISMLYAREMFQLPLFDGMRRLRWRQRMAQVAPLSRLVEETTDKALAAANWLDVPKARALLPTFNRLQAHNLVTALLGTQQRFPII